MGSAIADAKPAPSNVGTYPSPHTPENIGCALPAALEKDDERDYLKRERGADQASTKSKEESMTIRGFLIVCLWIAAPWLMFFLWLAGGLRGELGSEAMATAMTLIIPVTIAVMLLALIGAVIGALGYSGI